MYARELDSMQWAFVAAVARKNGNDEQARYFEDKSKQTMKREIADNRAWRRRLNGKEW
jgi:hypothetical protein